MTQPTVFISYSPADEAEKEVLMKHLGVLQQQGLIEVWADDQLFSERGEIMETAQVINQVKMVILLITPSFIGSKVISDDDLARILERQNARELVIYPIIARPCAWQKVPWLYRLGGGRGHQRSGPSMVAQFGGWVGV